ncbi:MAG: hypothetical protein H6563_11210 [Lewinellaceae bacterium]|nr:hypothetical protein [Lewinellaceae bacterium]
MISKLDLQTNTQQVLSDPESIKTLLKDEVEIIPEVCTWLGRLKLLHGVPFNYLVPDERMLPPESIRFFYLDINWVDALIDGAYSIGRNLTQNRSANQSDRNTDEATLEMAHIQLSRHASQLRAGQMGQPDPGADLETVTGFLLRSRAVSECPGIGVYAYANLQDTPEKNQANPSKIKVMPILRLERLGSHSEVLICLLAGDAYRVDIHEALENLHYGIDGYDLTDGKISNAKKGVRSFTRDSHNKVTLDKSEMQVDISACFRHPDSGDGRTVNVKKLVDTLGGQLGKKDFDSAQLGFEMTEGVGMVKFVKE